MKYSFLFTFLSLIVFSVYGQKGTPLSKVITHDTSLIYKELPNGLHYYIKKNAKPEKNCLLRLVVNVGSLQEEEHEQGIAHFVEHLAFNGTKNFPKRRIIEELELLGNKFGPDINAHTSFNQTVYEIEVPTRIESSIDKGLAILYDWAFQINFEEEEVAKEVGVILSERRSRLSTLEQSQRKIFELEMNNSRHCSRFPIGDSTIIATAKAKLLKDFYQKWYRPDAMSIIVVGDFVDAKIIENKLLQLFSSVPKKENPAPILSYKVPKSKEFKTLTLKDKEKTRFSFNLTYRHNSELDSLNTVENVKKYLTSSFAIELINKYLNELPQKSEMPFISCGFRVNPIDKNQTDCTFSINLKENELDEGIKRVLKERLRLLQHEFSNEEFEMIRLNYIKSFDIQISELANIKHQQFLREIFQSLENREPILDMKAQYEFSKKVINEITLAEVNANAKKMLTKQQSGYLYYWGVDKESIQHPSDSSLLSLIQQAENEPIEKIINEKTDKKLITQILKPQPYLKKKFFQLIEKENNQPELFVTEYEYANGAKVVVLPTKFKEDEVRFSASSKGGTSLTSTENRFNAYFSSRIIGGSGLGNLTPVELNNLSFNKFISLSPSISERSENIYGSFVQKDAEFFMQYLHATFVMPRKDSLVFNRFIKAQKQNIINANLLPSTSFYDSLSWFQSSYHPRTKPMTINDLDNLNLDKMLHFYKERFEYGGDFTFFFVGNINAVPNFENLLNTYIGTLKKPLKNEKPIVHKYETPKGKHYFEKAASTEPRNSVQISIHGKQKDTRKNNHQLYMLKELLEQRLTIKLREEASAVYGVSISAYISSENEYNLSISFNCEPNHEKQLIDFIYQTFEEIKTKGATQDELKKIVENRIKTTNEARKNNGYLLSTLSYNYNNNKDLSILKNTNIVNKYYLEANTSDFKKWAKKYFKRDNETIAVLKAKIKEKA